MPWNSLIISCAWFYIISILNCSILIRQIVKTTPEIYSSLDEMIEWLIISVLITVTWIISITNKIRQIELIESRWWDNWKSGWNVIWNGLPLWPRRLGLGIWHPITCGPRREPRWTERVGGKPKAFQTSPYRSLLHHRA